ncbi:MAG: phosphoribosylaminoimidazolesuccinocarboxamide synthase [Acidimicrobiales bacterium]
MSDLSLQHSYSGKVRDLFEFDDRHLLLVATDRLSAFDVVMNEPIPQKGRVLTGMTNYWLREFAVTVPSALVSCDPTEIDNYIPGFKNKSEWHGRSMLARKAVMLPLECIVRGRLAGQAYEEYVKSGTVHQMAVPAGMQLTDAFAKPLFTPSTKAAEGHDINIDLATAASLDSSRIWPADQVRSGETPPAFDKQPFRDWLTAQSWDRTPPPPTVPPEVIAITSARYIDAYERVTGHSLNDWYGA